MVKVLLCVAVVKAIVSHLNELLSFNARLNTWAKITHLIILFDKNYKIIIVYFHSITKM